MMCKLTKNTRGHLPSTLEIVALNERSPQQQQALIGAKMRIQSFIIFVSVILSGCAAPMKNVAHISLGAAKNPGNISDSTGFRSAQLGLSVASTPTPGGIPSGVGVGVAAARLLASGDFQALAKKNNHFEVWMPASEASNEAEAQLKMGSLMESAILKAIPSPYQTKIREYENSSTFGAVDRYREILINGPNCENWSCVATGPIPTASAYQWVGKMVKTDEPGIPGGSEHFAYAGIYGASFAKITKEYDKSGLVAGHWHKYETEPVSGFDYERFFLRISANLPDWAFFYMAPRSKDNPVDGPALLNKGVKISTGG